MNPPRPRLRPPIRAAVIMILIGVAGAMLFARNPWGVLVAALLAALVALASRAGRRPIRLVQNAMGVAWMHPERGAGSLQYRDVGAMIIREDWGGAELAIYLVPKAHSESRAGRLQPANSFVLTAGDVAPDPAEGESKLKEFTLTVLPRLPVEVTLDRGTRQRLSAWGIEPPPPPRAAMG